MKFSHLIIVAFSFLWSCQSGVQETKKESFDFNWRFSIGDANGAEKSVFDDSAWKMVNVPHDWSIEGSFSKENPSFSRGGWLPAGKCAYRKSFNVESNQKDQRFVIYFDGVYRNSEVFINGHSLGMRPLGYIAFHYDMTPYINFGGENIITVKVDNSSQPGSRWYTGTGIYRHVHLITTNKLYVPVWGTYIVANDFSREKAVLKIETKIQNDFNEAKEMVIRYSAIDDKNEVVETMDVDQQIDAGTSLVCATEFTINNPKIWSMKNPNRYTIKTELLVDGKVMYTEKNKTGIRKLHFDAQNGFFLNGKNVKLKGVCLHHAGGPLGAAIHRRTIERQLEKLREMGCNAVRTAHNPFSEEFLDVCDSVGFLVMNEMFDEWEKVKEPATTQNGKKIRIPVDFYANIFKEWADIDMTDFVLRDRNHPSVIMWSIGNEIDQMRRPEGEPIGKRLAAIVHSLDYRPVTNGVHGYGWGVWPDSAAATTSDIYGYNYIKDDGLDKERAQNPGVMTVITEHESAQSFYPRSTYLYDDAKKAWWDKLGYEFDDAYEWVEKRDIRGVSGMDAWKWIKERDYIMGMFIWTGWDYLGEVIPFGWPARSSSFAPIDLCGFPKDGYYFYQSQWSKEPMVHIFPHWNLEGMEGKKVTVYAFTNGDEVELFQDGKSLGNRTNNINGVEYLEWDVVYQPGTLKAVSYKDGKEHAEKVVKTAGKPAKITAKTRRLEMKANGQDLIYVECTILDKAGNEVPIANNMIEFELRGPALLAGVGNGDNRNLESFKTNKHSAFNGKCLAIIQSTKKAGEVKLTAKSKGLEAASFILSSK